MTIKRIILFLLTFCVVLPIYTMDDNNNYNARLVDATQANTALTTQVTFIPLHETDFVGLDAIFDRKQRLGNQLWQLINENKFTLWRNIFDKAKSLIAEGADVNIEAINGKTPLLLAADSADEKLCTLLLESGAKVYHKDTTGKIALDYAVLEDSRPTAEVLVEAMLQAPIPGQAQRMVTVMLCFSKKNEPTTLKNIFRPILRRLLKDERELYAYRKVSALPNTKGKFLCDVKNHLLQKYFAQLTAKDKKSELMQMAACGNTIYCKFLLDQKKVDVSHANGLGTTALHEAVRGSNPSTCDFLMNVGANPFCIDCENQTALHVASNLQCNDKQLYWQLDICALLVKRMIEKAGNPQDVFDIVNNLTNDSIKTYLLREYFSNYKAQ